ncbi:MAG: hypothetical protein MUE40_21655, partial [Anaerolineae bacterium]|nr:hypothetical protein [Anaerolineae bacterium]
EAEVEAAPVAAAEDFETALQPLSDPANVPPDITIVEETSGIFTTEEIAAAAPAAVAEDYAALLAEYGHQYRVGLDVLNQSCNSQYFFTQLSYSVDAFENAAAATAYLADARLTALTTAEGYTLAEGSEALYLRQAADCAGTTVGEGRVYLQRGRYVATVSGIVSPEILTSVPQETLLSVNVAQLFEQFLAAPYRSELR